MPLILRLALATAALSLLPLHLPAADKDIVRADGTALYRGESRTAYRVNGANVWYAPLLGCRKGTGDRHRLRAEIDSLKALGINSLRVFAGVEVSQSDTFATQLTLTAGSSREELWRGMDLLLCEAKERGMTVTICLTPDWHSSPDWQAAYTDYIKTAAARVNSKSKTAYRDDPTILAWELCDAPRITDAREVQAFAAWVTRSCEELKSVDANHLVCIGMEGESACLGDTRLYHRLLLDDHVDLITLQLDPLAQGWTSVDRLFDAMPHVILRTDALLEDCERTARKAGKPVLVTSFAYPRDNCFTSPGTLTYARDAYFDYMLGKFGECRAAGSPVAGGYFQGWGGTGHDGTQTKPSALYVADIPPARRGARSVYSVDTTTLSVMRRHSPEATEQ